jgi:hypothetical protein
MAIWLRRSRTADHLADLDRHLVHHGAHGQCAVDDCSRKAPGNPPECSWYKGYHEAGLYPSGDNGHYIQQVGGNIWNYQNKSTTLWKSDSQISTGSYGTFEECPDPETGEIDYENVYNSFYLQPGQISTSSFRSRSRAGITRDPATWFAPTRKPQGR